MRRSREREARIRAALAEDTIEEVSESQPQPQGPRTQRWNNALTGGLEWIASNNSSTSQQEPGTSTQQLGPLGIPNSFEGLSGIGGQNVDESQYEESLPQFQHSNLQPSQLDRIDWNAEPESLPHPHANFVYSRSGEPVAQISGDQLVPVLPPHLLSTTAPNPRKRSRSPSAEGQSPSKRRQLAKSGAASSLPHAEQSVSRTKHSKRKQPRIRDGDVSFDIPASLQSDPDDIEENGARKPTGPRLLRPNPMEAPQPLTLKPDGRPASPPYTGSGLEKAKELSKARRTALEHQGSQSQSESFESSQAGTSQSSSRGRSKAPVVLQSPRRRDRSARRGRGGSTGQQSQVVSAPSMTHHPLLPTGPTLGFSASNPVIIDSDSQPLNEEWNALVDPLQEYVKDYQVEGTGYMWNPGTNTPPREDGVVLGPPERVAAAMKAHAEAVEAAGFPDLDGMAAVPDLPEDTSSTRIDTENFHGLRVSRRPGSITSGLSRTSGAEEIEIPLGQGPVRSPGLEEREREGPSYLAPGLPVLPWESSQNVMSGEDVAEGPKRDEDQESGKAVVAEEDSQEIARANAAPESPIEDTQGDLPRTSPITRESSAQDFNTRRTAGNPPHHYRVSQRGKALPSFTSFSSFISTSDKHGNDSVYVPPNQQAVMPLTYGDSSSFQGASGTVSSVFHGHAPGTDFGDLSSSTGHAVMRSQEYAARLAMENAERMLKEGRNGFPRVSPELREGENGTDDADADGESHPPPKETRPQRAYGAMNFSDLFAVSPRKRQDIPTTSQEVSNILSEPPIESQRDDNLASNGVAAPSSPIPVNNVPKPVGKVLVTATQESLFSTDGERNPILHTGLMSNARGWRPSPEPPVSMSGVSLEEAEVEADIVIPETQLSNNNSEYADYYGSLNTADFDMLAGEGPAGPVAHASPVVLVPGTASARSFSSLNSSQDPFTPPDALPARTGGHKETGAPNHSLETPGRQKRVRSEELEDDGDEAQDRPAKRTKINDAPNTSSNRATRTKEKVPSRTGRDTTDVPRSRQNRDSTTGNNVPSSSRSNLIASSPLTPVNRPSSPLRPVVPVTPKRIVPPRTYRKTRTMRTTRSEEEPFEFIQDSEDVSSLPKNMDAPDASQDPFKSLAKTSFPAPPRKQPKARVVVPHRNRSNSNRRALRSSVDPVTSPDFDTLPPPLEEHRKGVRSTKLSPIPDESEMEQSLSTVIQPGITTARQGQGRCFAPWNKMYHPATVVGTRIPRSKSKKQRQHDAGDLLCKVQYDDESWAELPLSELYHCELRKGDEIQIPGKKGAKFSRTGRVSDLSAWVDKGTVGAELLVASKGKNTVFASKDIAVKADVVERKWTDRKIQTLGELELANKDGHEQTDPKSPDDESMEPVQLRSSSRFARRGTSQQPALRRSSPPPSRVRTRTTQVAASEPAGGSSRAHQVDRLVTPPETHTHDDASPLRGYGFIIALSVSDEKGQRVPEGKREREKRELEDIIVELGGRVVNDAFETLFQWNGQISDDGSRWIWNKGELTFLDEAKAQRKKSEPKTSLTRPERLVLLADGVNRNKKYMMALAAGIPCVDRRWILHKLAYPWHSYLLAAGNCLTLDLTNCSQWVDHSYIDNPRSLREIHENPRLLRRPFADRSALFVYSSRRHTDIEEDKFNHVYIFPMLACLMGAARVEVVHDLKSAALKHKRYDMIVYENNEVPESLVKSVGHKGTRDVVCAGFNWVSDCIVAGCFLDG